MCLRNIYALLSLALCPYLCLLLWRDSWGWDWISTCQTESHSLVRLCWSLSLPRFLKQKSSKWAQMHRRTRSLSSMCLYFKIKDVCRGITTSYVRAETQTHALSVAVHCLVSCLCYTIGLPSISLWPVWLCDDGMSCWQHIHDITTHTGVSLKCRGRLTLRFIFSPNLQLKSYTTAHTTALRGQWVPFFCKTLLPTRSC